LRTITSRSTGGTIFSASIFASDFDDPPVSARDLRAGARASLRPVRAALFVLTAASASAQGTLEEDLRREDSASLARAARESGDPSRGALLFHRPDLSCASCHGAPPGEPVLGPDLARSAALDDPALVEALLSPSRTIRKGFEAVTIVTRIGLVVTGLVAEENAEAVALRDATAVGRTARIAVAEIVSRSPGKDSLMPVGLVNRLGSRQEFIDLLSYLREIGAKGPARALELAPDPSLLSPPLPEYEKDVDHAGMIASLDAASLSRGGVIYERLCASCHGTKDSPGSLPGALKFASGRFKGGSDPYSMYRTLTYGLGQMAAQTWMVPRQKYDVVHFIRESYLLELNPSAYFRVDASYFEKLPRGTSRGPEPLAIEPWVNADYGPSLMGTFEAGADGQNIAQKGIAVRLDPGPGGVSRGRFWALYEHDTLRVAAFWSGEKFIDWHSIHFDGRHGVHPRLAGRIHIQNPTGPGWGDPESGSFSDSRLRGRDSKPYGPLPREWARYRGLYHHGNRVLLSYSVGDTDVLEMPGVDARAETPVFTRTFRVGPRSRDLVLQVACRNIAQRDPASPALVQERIGSALAAFWELTGIVSPAPAGAEWVVDESGDLRLKLPRGPEALRFVVAVCEEADPAVARRLAESWDQRTAAVDPERWTRGGPPRWKETVTARVEAGSGDGAFSADVLAHPAANPWLCQVRFSGLDFFADGKSAALSTWDGDVWAVRGFDRPEGSLEWRRVASGLFQPLGLKVVGGAVYVACRDQIAVLRDLNGDGETDFYECFNSDHQVTEHFHEFAMGLETDAAGNFYYAKGARHALTALVPQHGTLLRVRRDGSRTEIVATGFRAPNGVCVNRDGSFFVTDQEGHWTPKNRINRVVEGGFYGNLWGYHEVKDAADSAMEQPLCWITNAMDRSPAELVWVPSGVWGPLAESLLSLSYGYGKVFVVPHEELGGKLQGGVCALPVPQFPTGVMRGRFHPVDGQLYLCGMYAWAGTQQQPGGFYRVRFTGRPVHVPLSLKARRGGMELRFSGALDRASAEKAMSYAVKAWSLKRSANYGSGHLGERKLAVAGAKLLPDGCTVFVEVPELAPVQCMEIRYALRAGGGEDVRGVVHNTVHALGE
jgi:putative heme-binding domain-containing protein